MINKSEPRYKRFPCVMPSWDNTPRRKKEAVIFNNSTPELFRKWLIAAIIKAHQMNEEERIVFINAWNE